MNVRDEAVRQLLLKADQDAMAAAKLAVDPDVADEIIGFHLQQAAEKRLKALLTFFAIPYRRTHDVLELLDALIRNGHLVPTSLEKLQELTPFAVEYRYESLGEYQEEPMDRQAALRLIENLKHWAEAQIHG